MLLERLSLKQKCANEKWTATARNNKKVKYL